MKKLIIKSSLFLLLLSNGLVLKAQGNAENNSEGNQIESINLETQTKNFEHQFGFNATQLIQTLLGNGGFALGSPYQVNYKLLINSKENCFINAFGLRLGYGQFNIKDKQTQQINNFTSSNNFSQSNLRLGLEVQKSINEKWLVFAGVDYTFTKNNSESESVFDNPPNFNSNKNTMNEKINGIGPVFGVQYNIGKHIVLNTELSFYVRNGKSEFKQETNFNGFINTQTINRETTTANIMIPAFVNLNFRF